MADHPDWILIGHTDMPVYQTRELFRVCGGGVMQDKVMRYASVIDNQKPPLLDNGHNPLDRPHASLLRHLQPECDGLAGGSITGTGAGRWRYRAVPLPWSHSP